MKNAIENKLKDLADIVINKYDSYDDSLMGGKAGAVLFLSYLSRYANNCNYKKDAEYILKSIFENGSPNDPTYARGAAGLVWLIIHLSENKFIEYNYKEGLSDIISYLMDSSDQYVKHGNYDFLHGLLGFLHALLEGGITYQKEIKKLSNHIISMGEAVENEKGFIWKSYDIETLVIKDRVELGLAHGLSANISILSKTYNILKDSYLKNRIKETIFFLKNSINDTKGISLFPDMTYLSGNINRDSRLSWCNGDLCIALACQNANNIENNRALIDQIFTHSLSRIDLNKNSVFDAGICHGTSGIAHIFNKQFLLTKNIQYAKVANYWLEKTLLQAYHKNGFAGYKSLQGVERWYDEIGLLTGISGIGLSLLGFTAKTESAMKWDKSILLS